VLHIFRASRTEARSGIVAATGPGIHPDGSAFDHFGKAGCVRTLRSAMAKSIPPPSIREWS
jgi:hypothetical protein